jgi:hAT family C-terminal dimerisation region
MDYLPIQASSVPSERVFSSGAETMTKRRNRISPVLMEALQMVKFFLKKDRLNFMKGWVTAPAQMAVDVDDDDVLATIVNDLSLNDGMGIYMDHVIGVIGDEEGDEEDDDITLEP